MSQRSRKSYPTTGNRCRNRSGRVFSRIGKKTIAINVGRHSTKKQRESFKTHLDRLVGAKVTGAKPDKSDLEWLARLPDEVHDQLHQKGLCDARNKPIVFADYLDTFFSKRAQDRSVAEMTTLRWRTACKHAREFFRDATLQSITRDDVKAYRSHLQAKPGHGNARMSEATVRKNCSILSGAVAEAMQAKLVDSNPFDCVPKGNFINPHSEIVVPAEAVMRVIEQAADPEDKIILALGRFAGLRIPSEVQRLTWDDIVAEGVLRVYGEKTNQWRKTPMMKPLIDLLKRHKPDGALGSDFILPRLRKHSGLGVRGRRLCEEAGVPAWRKFFHSLRKSYASDLTREFGPGDVAAWLGHSSQVLHKHYVRRNDDDFTMGVGSRFAGDPPGGNRGGMAAQIEGSEVVATGVASAATPVGLGESDAAQPSSLAGVANQPDESCLSVTDADGQAGGKRNGRYWTTKSATKPRKTRKGSKLAVTTGVAGGSEAEDDLLRLAQLISRQPKTVRDLIRALLTGLGRTA